MVILSCVSELSQRNGDTNRKLLLSNPSTDRSQVPINVRTLPEARSRSAVNGEAEFCARPVKPFGRGRPWVRRTRALCKFN